MKKPSRRSFFFFIFAAVAGLLGFQIGQDDLDTEMPPQALEKRSGEAPLIGIASLVGDDYIRAVRQAGGIPVVLPNTDGSAAQIQAYLELLDGLLLPGGADIPPSEYGEEAHETVRVLDDSRYQFEKSLSTAWITKSQKPLLGICLGSQWINVASGGSLVQDIPSELGVNHRDRNHAIRLEPDSRLRGILGTSLLEVNSRHHQSVKRLGDGLRIVARCPDGVVEATETTDPDRFLIGVQWHPESLVFEDERQAKLLKAFIDAAREDRAKGTAE